MKEELKGKEVSKTCEACHWEGQWDGDDVLCPECTELKVQDPASFEKKKEEEEKLYATWDTCDVLDSYEERRKEEPDLPEEVTQDHQFFEWEFFMSQLLECMRHVDTHETGLWVWECDHIGWRNQTGGNFIEVDVDSHTCAADFLRGITPDCDCTVRFETDGHRSINGSVSHHDSPTGEYREIRPATHKCADCGSYGFTSDEVSEYLMDSIPENHDLQKAADGTYICAECRENEDTCNEVAKQSEPLEFEWTEEDEEDAREREDKYAQSEALADRIIETQGIAQAFHVCVELLQAMKSYHSNDPQIFKRQLARLKSNIEVMEETLDE